MTARKLQITYRKTDDLIPYIRNARKHSEEQVATIAGSIKEFDFTNPILVDDSNNVIAGHGRLQAARLLKIEEVPTISLSHLSPIQQRAYVLADNKIALDATWDNDLLKIEIEQLKDENFDMALTGFKNEEMDSLLKTMEVDQEVTEDNFEPKATIQVITKPGDVWIMGNHRLMCGDSTFVDSVDKLMAGKLPVLMVTDPPYGVNYDPKWRDEADLGVGERSTGKVDNDDQVDWSAAYSLFTGDVAYVWHAGLFTGEVGKHLQDNNFSLISQIIWVKQHFALSRGDYHWKHEPCWYAVRKGKTHNWQGKRDQATTWDINNNNAFGGDAEKTWGHGTQKPLECMARPIQNNTEKGQFVYDPFGGSGTTLVACEQLKRNCLMMEINPTYCDMIVRRWQELTGKDAINLHPGLSFNQLEAEANGKPQ